MSSLLNAVGLRGPNEARMFGFLGGFGIAVTALYWVLSYEPAGTVLLGAFAGVTAGLGYALGRAASAPAPAVDAERPLLDESGRLPSPTLAPFAVAIGLSVGLTSIVFGPAPLLVAAPPVLWGVTSWLRRAVAELRAVEGRRDR